MDKHLTAVGVLFIGFGSLGVTLSLFAFGAIILIAGQQEDVVAFGLVNVVGISIVIPVFLVEALKIASGIALLQHRPWARIPALILSFLSLLAIPIGTAYGIYAIWVLMKDDTARLFSASADQQ